MYTGALRRVKPDNGAMSLTE